MAENTQVALNTKKSSRIGKFLTSKKVVPYIFVLPFFLSFSVLTLYPAINGIIMSFRQILPGVVENVGFDNYARVFNLNFYDALWNTVIYVLCTTVLLTIVPMLLAIFLNSETIKLKTIFRASLFLPALTSTIVGGMIFRLMFSESSTSIGNQLISLIGLGPLEWRYSAVTAMFLMVILAFWRWTGVNLLYYLAALQNISESLYEQADIDGASAWDKLRLITIPHLKPITVFVSTITIINGFRMFEESFVYWEATSPGNIGLTIVGYIYQQGVGQNDLGFGAAIGVVLMIIIFIISSIYLGLTGTFGKGDGK
ncbi:sugar ABC transporter permease [Marinilactibacillus sp. XAAS-LB27]|uniref:carbohydrate ABC transporter permease n=1 Tax=Marinilactibacillus sp. XAAS-LB27 TaxID=3114538 RepID=UPI002E178F4D|nr:sugar ABC transporter permease [Marinilactibacillus sp. XAAS-LB27]